MSWRTVVVSKRCKLDFKLGYMVIRCEDTKRIFLDDVAILMVENPAISLTGCLLDELVERKIKVIFCDSKHTPLSELVPCRGNYDSPRKIKAQIEWNSSIKAVVWTNIVADKIKKQAEFLSELNLQSEADLLRSYIGQLELNDKTNREAHAAKVYFNGVFGMDFNRHALNAVNAALNYGYSIVLSAFNREVTSNGYLTQLGLFHDNTFNHFNLSSDLMEPFRILVDREVKSMGCEAFGQAEKYKLVNLLNKRVLIGNSQQTTLNAIKIYSSSVFRALNEQNAAAVECYRLQQ